MGKTAADELILIVFVSAWLFLTDVLVFLDKINVVINLLNLNIIGRSWRSLTLEILCIVEILSILLLNHLQVTAWVHFLIFI